MELDNDSIAFSSKNSEAEKCAGRRSCVVDFGACCWRTNTDKRSARPRLNVVEFYLDPKLAKQKVFLKFLKCSPKPEVVQQKLEKTGKSSNGFSLIFAVVLNDVERRSSVCKTNWKLVEAENSSAKPFSGNFPNLIHYRLAGARSC